MSGSSDGAGLSSEKRPKIQITDHRHWARKEGEADLGEEAPEEPTNLYPTYVEQLLEQVKSKDEKLREFMAKVEEENEAFRIRTRKEVERRVNAAVAEVVRECLSVLDNLERAVSSGKAHGDASSLLDGVELVYRQLFDLLGRQGLSPVETDGLFDPRIHEAVEGVPVDDEAQDQRILEVIQMGYRLGETLLRPAQVRVGVFRRAEPTVEG